MVPLLGAVCGAVPHRVFAPQAVAALGLEGFTAAVKVLQRLLCAPQTAGAARIDLAELRTHFDADGYLPAAWQEAAWADIQQKVTALAGDAEARHIVASVERLAAEVPPAAPAVSFHLSATSMPGFDDIVHVRGKADARYSITAIDASGCYADIESDGPAPRVFHRVPRALLQVSDHVGQPHHSTSTNVFLNDGLNAYFDDGGTPPPPEQQADASGGDLDEEDIEWDSL
jgi:hypothetical protein